MFGSASMLRLSSPYKYYSLSCCQPSFRFANRIFSYLLLVPLTGIEPVRYCYRGILSPLRLPVPPQRHIDFQPMDLHHWEQGLLWRGLYQNNRLYMFNRSYHYLVTSYSSIFKSFSSLSLSEGIEPPLRPYYGRVLTTYTKRTKLLLRSIQPLYIWLIKVSNETVSNSWSPLAVQWRFP